MPYYKRLLPPAMRYGAAAMAYAARYGGRSYLTRMQRRRVKNRNYMRGGISRTSLIRRRNKRRGMRFRTRLRRKGNPFKIAMRRGNISRSYKIKCITQVNMEFNWDKDNTAGAQSIADNAKSDASLWFGNRYENWEEYKRQDDYENFITERISTRLSDFKVHRIVNTVTTDQDDTVTAEEDKVTWTDPTVWFYRPHNGKFPGAFTAGTNNDIVFEIAKKKCIKDCKDGFWWGKRWRNKSDRIMKSTHTIKQLFENPANVTWANAMNALGILPLGDDKTYNNQNYMGFSLARQCPYPTKWFNHNMDDTVYKSQERKVTDYLSCLMTTWVTVRYYNQQK